MISSRLVSSLPMLSHLVSLFLLVSFSRSSSTPTCVFMSLLNLILYDLVSFGVIFPRSGFVSYFVFQNRNRSFGIINTGESESWWALKSESILFEFRQSRNYYMRKIWGWQTNIACALGLSYDIRLLLQRVNELDSTPYCKSYQLLV